MRVTTGIATSIMAIGALIALVATVFGVINGSAEWVTMTGAVALVLAGAAVVAWRTSDDD